MSLLKSNWSILMEISRHWRLQQQRYGLVGEVCPHCDEKIFPPRDICPNCSGEAKTPYVFSGKGEVYSFTTIYDAPEGYEGMTPYTVALIKLAEGPLVTAQLTDVDNGKVDIGTPVEMVTRKLREDGDRGMLVYGYKFRPKLVIN
jgi:scaffold protein (connect acetoacetyl-CoA thiolase and HMG-CoA synthase)